MSWSSLVCVLFGLHAAYSTHHPTIDVPTLELVESLELLKAATTKAEAALTNFRDQRRDLSAQAVEAMENWFAAASVISSLKGNVTRQLAVSSQMVASSYAALEARPRSETRSCYEPGPETQGCSAETTFDAYCGFFTDGFQGEYGESLSCSWSFSPEVPPGKTFAVTFTITHLDLEAGDEYGNCYDALRIYQGSILKEAFCGSSLELPVLMNTIGATRVLFNSDGSVGGTGFNISWQVSLIDLAGSEGCNTTVNTDLDAHVIISESSLQCGYIINPPDSVIVAVQLVSWTQAVTSSLDCTEVGLELIDGWETVNQSLVGKFCGALDEARCADGRCPLFPNVVLHTPAMLKTYGTPFSIILKYQSCVCSLTWLDMIRRHRSDPRELEKRALLDILEELDCPHPPFDWHPLNPVCNGGCREDIWFGETCYDWTYVTCDEKALHVVRLDLEDLCVSTGNLSSAVGQLESLRRLTLTVAGSLPASMSRLTQLEILDFINAYDLTGTLPDLSKNANLREVDLQDTSIQGPVPTWLGQLSKLEFFAWSRQLSRDGKFLTNGTEVKIPTQLGLCSALTVLSFDSSTLTGTLPTELGNLASLQSLKLQENPNLSGTLPSELGRCRSLYSIVLGGTKISGTLPTQVGHWTSLTTFMAGSTLFSGTIPTEIGQMSALRAVWMNRVTGLSGTLPTQMGRLNALQRLFLTSTRLSGSIPSGLFGIQGLASIDLSLNAFSEVHPQTVFESEWVDLSRNSISSVLPPISFSLKDFSISGNLFRGEIVATDGLGLTTLVAHDNLLTSGLDSLSVNASGLKTLDIRRNLVAGTIPSGLGNVFSNLYLDNNNLSGKFPEPLTLRCRVVSARGNRLSGTLPQLFHGAMMIEQLDLHQNMLVGPLPGVTPKSSLLLSSLVLSRNHLCGTIPPSLAFLPRLERLVLNNNRLRGTLPAVLFTGELLTFQVAQNDICGTVPQNAKSRLRDIKVSYNTLRGEIPGWLFKGAAAFIDLSHNHLSGTIPSVVNLPALVSLSLANNKVSGTIPPGLAAVYTLSALEVSTNSISGTLPDLLWNLGTLFIDDTYLVAESLPPWVSAGSRYTTFERFGVVVRCPALVSDKGVLGVHPHLYNWTLCFCMPGFYGRRGVCSKCPPGADCSDGANMRALRGFWCDFRAYSKGEPVECHSCPAAQCCDQDRCNLDAQCAPGFHGTLCGTCANNMTVGLPRVCMAPQNCTGASWIVPLLIIAALGYVLYLAATWQPVAKRHAATFGLVVEYYANVLVYFFQILPLVISGLAARVTASRGREAVFALSSVFSMAPQNAGGSTTGLCFAPNLDVPQIISLGLMAPAALLIALSSLFVISTACRKLALFPQRDGVMGRLLRVGGYSYAALVVAELAFSTITKTTFQLVQCVRIQDRLVMFHSGDVECFRPWQIVALCGAIPLVAYPAVLLWLATTARHRRSCASAHSSIKGDGWSGTFDAVCAPYHGKATPIWAGVVLFRRLVLIFAANFIHDLQWRAWTVAAGCALGLTSTAIIRPHVYPVVHWADLSLQFTLVLLAMVNTEFSVADATGVSLPHRTMDQYASLIIALSIGVPVGVTLGTLAWFLRSRRTKQSHRGPSELSPVVLHEQQATEVRMATLWEPVLSVEDVELTFGSNVVIT